MTTLYFVRHGAAESVWGNSSDPGLSDQGHRQARHAATILETLGILNIVSSPLRRAVQTAEPLAHMWQIIPKIDQRFSEIPFPENIAGPKMAWLLDIMQKCWPQMDDGIQKWRADIFQALREMDRDTVIFSHFIAINVAVGFATGDSRVVQFSPDNGSVTILRKSHSDLDVIELGNEKRSQSEKKQPVTLAEMNQDGVFYHG